MGIRHLKTYMNKHLKNGVYRVWMLREIRKAAKGSRQPLVVIDLMALFELFCFDRKSTLCGSRVRVIEQEADEFFRRLTEAGARLVFFYDGPPQQIKLETWTKRQHLKYENMIAIIDAVDQGVPLQQIANKFYGAIPNNTCIKLNRIASKHGPVITAYSAECDQELAVYAKQHKAFAIITNDTDFLIYEGDWHLWSVQDINLGTLETLEYDRNALRRELDLSWPGMALWATLGGNDFFQYDTVVPFHNSLQGNNKFGKLAQYVRSLPIANGFNKGITQQIVQRVYAGQPIPENAEECLMQSVYFYSTNPALLKRPMDPMEAFLIEEEHTFVLSILKGTAHNCTIQFFDFRSSELGNYFDIIVPLIARTAGIILFHRQHERKDVTILSKRGHLEPYAAHTIPAIFPTDIIPPHVMELLSQDVSLQEALMQKKLQLLRWVCSDDVDDGMLQALPARLVTTVLTLVTLVRNDALLLFEADLLLTIVNDELNGGINSNPTIERYPVRVDPRAFRVGFLFQKVYSHIARTAKSIGLPADFCCSVPYDGHRFHNCYAGWRSGQWTMSEGQHWRLYAPFARQERVTVAVA
uniref:Constitutive coactivator of peroxisome proliferator-activated receptor gamma n=1 Tax=Anopheles triannulatus TaxID=58253 RepID=A0A2M4AJU0_9DIPT